MTQSKIYVGEFNRPHGDNIRHCARRLERRGIPASVLPHKTSLRIERPPEMGWMDFKQAIRGQLNPRIGSVLLHSQSSGNSYLCRNRGNRPGRFERVYHHSARVAMRLARATSQSKPACESVDFCLASRQRDAECEFLGFRTRLC